MPNPSAGSFMLNASSDADASLILRVIDIFGRVIERKQMMVNQTTNIGQRYRPHMCLAEIIQMEERSCSGQKFNSLMHEKRRIGNAFLFIENQHLNCLNRGIKPERCASMDPGQVCNWSLDEAGLPV